MARLRRYNMYLIYLCYLFGFFLAIAADYAKISNFPKHQQKKQVLQNQIRKSAFSKTNTDFPCFQKPRQKITIFQNYNNFSLFWKAITENHCFRKRWQENAILKNDHTKNQHFEKRLFANHCFWKPRKIAIVKQKNDVLKNYDAATSAQKKGRLTPPNYSQYLCI